MTAMRATQKRPMVIALKLTKKQAAQVLRDFENEETGPYIAKGCRCIGCQILRIVLSGVRRNLES